MPRPWKLLNYSHSIELIAENKVQSSHDSLTQFMLSTTQFYWLKSYYSLYSNKSQMFSFVPTSFLFSDFSWVLLPGVIVWPAATVRSAPAALADDQRETKEGARTPTQTIRVEECFATYRRNPSLIFWSQTVKQEKTKQRMSHSIYLGGKTSTVNEVSCVGRVFIGQLF